MQGWMRKLVVSVSLLVVSGSLLALGRRLAGDTRPGALLVSVVAAAGMIFLMGSLYEWFVHRYVYHSTSRLKLWRDIHVIHERGHHWHRFPPHKYVVRGARVERIPVFPAEPLALCGTPWRRFVAWAGQYALYLSVAVPLAFAPAWFLTHNVAFTATAVLTGLTVCYFFIRVHDAIHHVGVGPLMERMGWFRFLNRHHYIHHIDMSVNVNFLLPLCDWLFGTLRTELTEKEKARWPSFEDACRLPPEEAPEGTALASGAPRAS